MEILSCLLLIGLSGIYMGLVDGRPLLGSAVLPALPERDLVSLESHHRSGLDSSRHKRHTANSSARLQRLKEIYRNLDDFHDQKNVHNAKMVVDTGSLNPFDNLDDSAGDTTVEGTSKTFLGQDLSKSILPYALTEKSPLQYSSLIPDTPDSSFSDDDSGPVSKRQQGWYIQYGKRSSPAEADVSSDRRHALEVQLLRAAIQLNGQEGNRALAQDSMGGAFSDDETDKGMSKRQQGWYTQYGKRSGDPLRLYLL